jgi:hypothetical protein
MKTQKTLQAIATLSILGGNLLIGWVSPANAKSTAPEILKSLGLIVTDCAPNMVEIWIGGNNERVCAYPNPNYPKGSYRLNPDNYQLSPIGSLAGQTQNQTQSQAQPQTQPQTSNTPSNNPGSVVINVGVPGTVNAYANADVYYIPNPNQQLAPNTVAGIKAVLSSQQLASGSCSNNPGVFITVNGMYAACAYPNSQYPAGRYSLTAQGL